jgi:hypothetical protein
MLINRSCFRHTDGNNLRYALVFAGWLESSIIVIKLKGRLVERS